MSLEPVYALTGVMLMGFAALTGRDLDHPHRWSSSIFWLILGGLFAFGSWLPAEFSGVLVFGLVALDASGRVTASHQEKATDAAAPPPAFAPRSSAPLQRRGWLVVLPVLMIPAVTILATLGCWACQLDMTRGGLLGLALGSLVGMGTSLALTGGSPRELLDEGRRLNATIGTVSLLPQLLAALGVIFAAAHIGELMARGVHALVPPDQRLGLVLANCLGMSLLAALTGNSFAAYPVIASGVLVPLLIRPLGADPAALGILTMTVGASGTLCTPMAANFNLVPAALLGLRDPYAVVRCQIPVAVAMWLLQVALMWALVA